MIFPPLNILRNAVWHPGQDVRELARDAVAKWLRWRWFQLTHFWRKA